jgi:glycosyltransferase involved in cell wall biosynthesis
MSARAKPPRKPVVLLELRPAFDGYAGIPQETRLLFRGLRTLEALKVSGLLQMTHRVLAKGTLHKEPTFGSFWLSEARRINRYSRVVISAAEKPFATAADWLLEILERHFLSATLTLQTLLGLKRLRLSLMRPTHFEDFVWRTLFSKTLPASEFALVTGAELLICQTPWSTMHMVGLNTFRFFLRPRYPKIRTSGIDIFIGQTPYPARLTSGTAYVIRYHDALPVFMPHTISGKSLHQATHFYALMSNVRSGAYFACVSDATRSDLLKMFPEVGDRAVTIHNTVSPHYFLDQTSHVSRVPGIIRSRLYGSDQDATGFVVTPAFLNLREQENFYKKKLYSEGFKYLLAVSTIEPRKNHARLLAAWEVLKAEVDPELKLVVVGTLGWGFGPLLKEFKTWIDRGELFMLNAVPAPDLRVLYRYATATVCPSLGEGFDFPGIESMLSGGVVIASDIPVHREIYGDAARFFNPYATASLVGALKEVIYAADAAQVQATLRMRGLEVAARYSPEKILPQWDRFLARVLAERGLSSRAVKAQRKLILAHAPVIIAEEG